MDLMIEFSPWSNPIDPHILFPIRPYKQLLDELNWSDYEAWLRCWNLRGGIDLAGSTWPSDTKNDWRWGFGLPFLSDIERYIGIQDQRILFGISGLPGSGKTSFGKWVEAACSVLNWSVRVVSLDDFYYPSKDLELAMAGNPWRVPRALPGSHSIQLLKETIEIWKRTGNLNVPIFDKSLRNGLGDRSGWRILKADVLVLEGWFLGCELAKDINDSIDHPLIDLEPITLIEKEYKVIVQKALKEYQPIWKEFERIWHLKAIDFISTKNWKAQQEHNLQKERGSSIKGEALDRFNRMIQTAIPIDSLQSIKSDVVLKLNTSREIKWVGLSSNENNP